MELLRIVAMLMIFFLHANYFSLGEVLPDAIRQNPVGSFIRITLEQLCIGGANVFVLISGWFGIKPSMKRMFSLLYQVFFFSTLVILTFLLLGMPVPIDLAIQPFFFGMGYWFLPAYFILFSLAPILNSFIDNTSKRQQMSVLVLFFFLEFVYGWATDNAGFEHGYSAISFVGLYLLARFLRAHALKATQWKARTYLLLYLMTTLAPVGIYFFTGHALNIVAYTSPFVILGSVSLMLGFSRLRIDSKMINSLACSIFPIYLVHQHPLVVPHFVDVMQSVYNMLGGVLYSVFVIFLAVTIGLLCVLLDKLRIVSWEWICKPCRTRK